jgi:hypothetical protein
LTIYKLYFKLVDKKVDKNVITTSMIVPLKRTYMAVIYLFFQNIYQSVFSNVLETKSMILLSFSTQQWQRKFLRS